MLKLLICIFSGLLIAVLVLQLRQQRLEINYQTSQLHNQIHAQQARLWNQQLQIAVATAPNAIQHTVDHHALQMVPRAPLPPQVAHWIDVAGDPITD
jgi:cell division protein FtsL